MTERKMTYMRKIVVKVFAVLLVCALCAHAEDTLLYFQIVDKPTIITFDNQTVAWDEYVWNKNGTDYSVNAARVVSMDGDTPSPLLLGFSSNGEFVPSGLSMMPMDDAYLPTFLYAVLPSNAAELSFAIELGNFDNGAWTTLATSGSLAYSSLESAEGAAGYTYLTSPDAFSLNGLMAWAPQAYPVPEPSSGLLLLVGAGLLALRRGRARAPRVPRRRRRS